MQDTDVQDTGPQFGDLIPGVAYRDRPSAFGICAREDGMIAVVRIHREDGTIDHDLPGGALDPGETGRQAMAREFVEEAGLIVEAGALIARARQFMPSHDEGPVNNLCAFYEAWKTGPQGAPEEPDHDLVWLAPEDAAAKMYKGAARWAIGRWLEQRG